MSFISMIYTYKLLKTFLWHHKITWNHLLQSKNGEYWCSWYAVGALVIVLISFLHATFMKIVCWSSYVWKYLLSFLLIKSFVKSNTFKIPKCRTWLDSHLHGSVDSEFCNSDNIHKSLACKVLFGVCCYHVDLILQFHNLACENRTPE